MAKVKDNEENVKNCSCPRCPTYNAGMKKSKETLFCGRGKAKCEFVKNGCICGGCIVYAENRLSGGYFCEAGKAA